MPMISGGTPRTAKLTKRASGVRLNSFSIFSDTTISAPAPSDVCELLPAVTEPLLANTVRGHVELDLTRLHLHFAGGEIGETLGDRVGRDFVVELTGLLRS